MRPVLLPTLLPPLPLPPLMALPLPLPLPLMWCRCPGLLQQLH